MRLRGASGREYHTVEKVWPYRNASISPALSVKDKTVINVMLLPAESLPTNDPGWQEALTTQTQTLAGIHHELINQVIDAGIHDDGRPFVAYQRQQSVSLNRVVSARSEPMDELLALLIVRSAAQGVAQLHAADFPHGHVDLNCIRLLGRKHIQLGFLTPTVLNLALHQVQDGWSLFRAPQFDPAAPKPCYDIYGLCMALLCTQAPQFWAMTQTNVEGTKRIQKDGGVTQVLAALGHASDSLRSILECGLCQSIDSGYQTIEAFIGDCTDAIGGQKARHASGRMQVVRADGDHEEEGRRSNFFNTDDIQEHIRKHRNEDDENDDSAKSEEPVIDEAMLAIVAKLVVVNKDQLTASINLAPGTCFPRHLLSKVIERAGVRYGLIEANIILATRLSNEVRRLTIARGDPPRPGKPGRNVYGNETVPLIQAAQVEIRKDGMEAVIHSVPDEAVDLDTLNKAVQDAGIRIALIPGALERISRGETEAHGCTVIARGEHAIQARRSQYQPSDKQYREEDEAQEVLSKLGQSPITLDSLRMVGNGESIAVWRQGTYPKDGYNVYGQTIPAEKIDQPTPAGLAGEGTELHRNKRLLVYLRAKRDGAMQILDDGTIRVIAVRQVHGDFEATDEEVDTDDLMVIHGDVADGIVIHTAGGLVVYGNLGDAEVQTGGNIEVHGDILPGSRPVQCAGSLQAANIQGRQLMAGEVTVANHVDGSEITATGEVTIGSIAGGRVVAAGNITVKEDIGDDAETPTELWAGHHVGHAIKRDLAILEEKKLRSERTHMLSERNDLREMIENISRTQYRFSVGGWMGKDYLLQLKDRVSRVKLRGSAIDNSLESVRHVIVDQVEESEQLDQLSDNTRAYIRAKTVHGGVTLKLADAESRTFKQSSTDVDYKMYEGED
jgi:uncharacterized protein (DUF342 family)